MKTLKSTLILASLFCAVVFMPSCEEETVIDLCVDVQCNDYDAECVEGDCVCTEITKDYLLGSWDYDNSILMLVFNEDGTLENAGSTFNYFVNRIDGIIYVHLMNGNLGTILYIQEGFDCNTFTFDSANETVPVSVSRQL